MFPSTTGSSLIHCNSHFDYVRIIVEGNQSCLPNQFALSCLLFITTFIGINDRKGRRWSLMAICSCLSLVRGIPGYHKVIDDTMKIIALK